MYYEGKNISREFFSDVMTALQSYKKGYTARMEFGKIIQNTIPPCLSSYHQDTEW